MSDSKETRLNIQENLKNLRFDRNIFAHLMRYFKVIEIMISLSKELGRPIRVLDVGCGEAYIPQIFNSSYIIKKSNVIEEYIGIDSDSEVLKIAEEKMPKSIKNLLSCKDITKIPWDFPDESFDLIVCLEVLEHIPKEFVQEILKEMKRISKNNVIIATPNSNGRSGKLPNYHCYEWSFSEFEKELERSGLRVINYAGIYSQIKIIKKYFSDFYSRNSNKYDRTFLSLLAAKEFPTSAYNIMWFCKV